ncbi:MAG: ABC transporter permease [Bacteroidota bacterium]
MLENYLKIAFKVLARKKFYSFISLFGISFTLMILMVIASFLDNELGSHSPMSNQDRITFLPTVKMQFIRPDTVYVIDTVLTNGTVSYDTTRTINNNSQSTSISGANYVVLDRYLRDLPNTIDHSYYSPSHTHDLFINSKKLSMDAIYTDAAYWRIFDFKFVEGGPYRETEVSNQAPSIVISETARKSYFGANESALGKEIPINRVNYKIIGVVKDVNQSWGFLNAELYIPFTHIRSSELQRDDNYLGGFEGAFLSASPAQRDLAEDEIDKKETLIPIPNPEDFNKLDLLPFTALERYARGLFWEEDKSLSLRYFYLVIGGLLSLFVLLPTLNLVNLNVTRIMERSSEIGVRKAFGAGTGDLLIQFIFENIILTLLGGIIGFILAIWLIQVLNASQVFPDAMLSFHFSIFVYGFLIILFFGIISGLLPALRMSKLHVVTALRETAV